VIGKVPKGAVQLFDLFGRGAFLRTENRRGTLSAAQWIVHIRSDFEVHGGQARIDVRQINLRQSSQRQTSWRQRLSPGVKQLHPQGLHGPGATVIGGTAANRQNHPLRARIQGGADQLAGAVGAAGASIAVVQRDQLQTAGFSHFDDRGVAVGQPAPPRIDG